jgi:hypothetical protein
MAVRLSALRTRRTLLPRNIIIFVSGTHFCDFPFYGIRKITKRMSLASCALLSNSLIETSAIIDTPFTIPVETKIGGSCGAAGGCTNTI